MRNDKDRFELSSSKRCFFRAPTPVGPASVIATDLVSEPTSLVKFGVGASNPSAITAAPARRTGISFSRRQRRRLLVYNIIAREPNSTSLTKTRRVVAGVFACVDGSRGVRVHV